MTAAKLEPAPPLSSPVIPPRSILIGPTPIGLGSADVESLFSYFCRVALQNGLTPGQLIFGRCTMLLAQEHESAAELRRTARAAVARRTVGVSESGYEFGAAIARLVGRPEVVRMHWKHALNGYSFARMTRNFGAYCPDCLRLELEPYERMTWELALVGACAQHRCLLVSRCGQCGRKASRLDLSARPWECPICGHDRRLERAPPAASAEIATAREFGAMVAESTAAKSTDYLDAPDCVDSLLDWAGSHGAFSVKRQAKFFSISVGTLSLWRNKRGRPTASRLMELALRLGQSLPAFFRGEFRDLNQAPAVPDKSAVWKQRRLTQAERLTMMVRTETIASLNPMRPMPDVAAELEVTPRTLRHIAPEQCSQMKTNYAGNRRRIKEAKLEWFCRKVDGYVAACLTKRQYPTLQGLSQTFGKPGIFREEGRRRYAKQAIRSGQELLPNMPEQLLLNILPPF